MCFEASAHTVHPTSVSYFSEPKACSSHLRILDKWWQVRKRNNSGTLVLAPLHVKFSNYISLLQLCLCIEPQLKVSWGELLSLLGTAEICQNSDAENSSFLWIGYDGNLFCLFSAKSPSLMMLIFSVSTVYGKCGFLAAIFGFYPNPGTFPPQCWRMHCTAWFCGFSLSM